jgi:hypothetical protein
MAKAPERDAFNQLYSYVNTFSLATEFYQLSSRLVHCRLSGSFVLTELLAQAYSRPGLSSYTGPTLLARCGSYSDTRLSLD